MCYIEHMDTTIRNLDERAYRELKAHAALTGRTIGETLNEAIRAYLARLEGMRRDRSLAELKAKPYPPGNERLSESIDSALYGS
jgi:plasmid stability protein